MPLLGSRGAASTTGFGGLTKLGYLLRNSLRFRSSASAYLNRTFSSGNTQIFTQSFWLKRGKLATNQWAGVTISGNAQYGFFFDTSDILNVYVYFTGSVWQGQLVTTQVFRDPSAWYHMVLAVDTTQATSSNRIKIYVNGSQITTFSTANYPNQNQTTNFNTAAAHYINQMSGNYGDCYMAEVNWIDGQQLTPSSFGKTDAGTGQWVPIKYSGTYGTNGFYLNFTDTSSTSNLVKDNSGNGNNWTPNNISLTAGTTYDSMTDVPTLTNATTGNYAVMNPLALGRNVVPTLSEGNLKATVGGSNGDAIVYGTIGVSSGKWYWEVTPTTIDSSYESMGITDRVLSVPADISLTGANWQVYQVGGQFQSGTNPATTGSAYGNSFTSNDVIGIALDMDNGKIFFSKNGVFQNSGNPVTGTNPAASGISGTRFPVQYFWTANSVRVINYGQRPFSYTPPSGFKALNSFNLP